MYWNKFWGRIRPATFAVIVLALSGCSVLKKQDDLAGAAVIDPAVQLKQQLENDYQAALELHREGDRDDARRAYQAILEQDATLSSPRYNLARLSLEAGDQDEAQRQLKMILDQKPGHKQANNLMGVILREKGQFSEAEAHYRAALATDPDFAPALRNLAILLDLYQGRWPEALALYEQYQALQSGADPKVKDWIFDLKRRMGEP